MSTEDTTPAAPAKPRVTGLGPKAQKLAALREKMAAQANGGNNKNFGHNAAGGNAKGAAGHKKTSFQRKAT